MKFNKRFVPCKLPLYKGILLLLLSGAAFLANSQSYVLNKSRSPQLHIKEYKQIAIGDIVGPSGLENERSMDLRDAVTSKLFNSNTYEVVDRNTLSQLLAAQKKGNVIVIDEKTISTLSKQLKSALLITGRVQTEKVEQKLHTAKNGTCTGGNSYYWLVTGEVSVQLKIIAVSTGKMIFSGPVTHSIRVQSTETCQQTAKFDLAPIVTKAFDALSGEVVKLLIPYTDQIDIVFQGPLIVLFKNPFKNLERVVTFFQIGDFEKGVQILKAYTTDNSLKDALKPKAHFNYALGLFCMKEYEQAKAELKIAMTLNPNDYTYQHWYERIDKEKETDKLAVMR